MAKKVVGTIATVEQLLSELKAAAKKNPDIEVHKAKHLGKVVELLTLNDNLSRVLKQLQGNALKHFLAQKEKGSIGFSEETKAAQIKHYVQTRFQSYMDDPDTAERAQELFNAAYPSTASQTEESANG